MKGRRREHRSLCEVLVRASRKEKKEIKREEKVEEKNYRDISNQSIPFDQEFYQVELSSSCWAKKNENNLSA